MAALFAEGAAVGTRMKAEIAVLENIQPKDFWSRVAKRRHGCWLWCGSINKSTGYGVVKRLGNRASTHRLSWMLKHGSIRPGLCVLHSCDVRACVRRSHLFLGTKTENAADRDQKGRQARGERQHLSKLTASIVRAIRRRFSKGETNKSALAREYGVNNSLIGFVVRRQIWKHV